MTNNNNLKPIFIGDVDWMRNDYFINTGLTIGGVNYPTVEHAYQGSKFTDKHVQQSIADAISVRDARKIGRNSSGIRVNWDSVKFTTMVVLLRQKFSSDPILSDRLIKTGTAPIIMNGYDSFWGTGKDGEGENKLGEALENVRSELQLINGIDPTDYDPKDENEESAGSLYDAIFHDPSDELAEACQNLFVGSIALLTLIDSNDFDAGFISRRTGVSLERAEDAVQKLRVWQSSVNFLKDFLNDGVEDEENDDSFIPNDEDEDDEDDWLNSPD